MTTVTEPQVKLMGPFEVAQDPPLYLSGLTKEDLPEMVRITNIDKTIFHGTGTFVYPFLDSHAEQRFAGCERYRARMGYNGQWAMRTQPDGPMVGWIAVYEPLETECLRHPGTGRILKTIDIGYWVSPEHAGKGYTSRALVFVKETIAIRELGAEAIVADAYIWNTASRRVLEKAGLTIWMPSKQVFIPKFGEEREVVTYAWFVEGLGPTKTLGTMTTSS